MKETEVMSEERPVAGRRSGDWVLEVRTFWEAMPSKGFFFILLACWLALFHVLGNSTLGYAKTTSLFQWLEWMYKNSEDDAHGRLIPFVVVGLFWWKRIELMAVPKRASWAALFVLVLGVWVHVVGYTVQQTQISVVGFFLGIYGLMGVIWGWKWLEASFFPYCLVAFCVPVSNLSGFITFPLRVVATKITGWVCAGGLGIDVIQDGTRIFDPNGAYQYEVAAACSGIRSLTAIVALSTIYAFVKLRSPWKRLLMVAAAAPLAVASNVFRLCAIVVAAEAFGQGAGNYVHESSWLSLLPYVPALGGMVLLGHWLREDRTRRPKAEGTLAVRVGQEL